MSEQLRRSHILPEFLYRPLYDEKHRFSILTAGVERKWYGQREQIFRLVRPTAVSGWAQRFDALLDDEKRASGPALPPCPVPAETGY